MKRSAPLRSDPEKLRAWRQRSKRIKPVSDKRMDERPLRAEVRSLVFERDGECVLRRLVVDHRCLGPLTPHHIVKEGQGGPYTLENLVAVCAWGNGWLETQRPLARELGLEKSRWDDLPRR